MILAEKIMKLRKQQGWSQEDLAIRLDISRQSVSKWESGRGCPSIDSLKEISRYFSVSEVSFIVLRFLIMKVEQSRVQ